MRLIFMEFVSSISGPACCSDLLKTANQWLHSHTELRVNSCETLFMYAAKKAALGDAENMVYTRNSTPHSNTYFQRGIRSRMTSTCGSRESPLGLCSSHNLQAKRAAKG